MKSIKTAFLILLTIALRQSIYAQGQIEGNGQVIQQQRNVATFYKLAVRIGMRVRITPGDPSKAELEGESNILKHIVTEVKNNELTIMLEKDKSFNQSKTVTVTIHVAKLDQVEVSTGCSVESTLPIQSDNLSATVETGSRLTAPITTQKLALTVKDGSQANLQGTVTEADIHLSGAGKLSADKLTIARATIQLDGASRADIHVTETLSASANGVSTINYTGSPTIKSQEVSGMSKIRKQE